jgi:hypothetical protein
MDWQSHFRTIFFETWQKAGLPDQQEFIAEYIDIREHGDFKKDWMNQSTTISPVIDGNQLRSVYGFGVLVGKIFSEMLGLTVAQTSKASDWCGRFNLGISLFDYICDELEGVSSATSLAVFQPFVKTNYSVARSLTPAEELLSNLAGSVLHDLKQAAVQKDGLHKTDQLFKAMKRMFEAENFVSKESLSAAADLKKIEKALYRKSAEPFRVMAEFTALMADANDSVLLKNARATGKALGYCYWLIDDAKDVWIDLKAGRWNLFLTLAAAEDPFIFAKSGKTDIESYLIKIWEQSHHSERISKQIIIRLVHAVKRLRLPEKVEHHNLGLVWASLWQWYNY